MNTSSQSDNELRLHTQAILAIADQYHVQETLIRKIYENELNKLQVTAKLKVYLSVLVTRHVKELLHISGVIKINPH